MRGTNTGLLPGIPDPTGATCDLPGIDVITIGDAGIVSVVGYFDQKTFVEQLGLQALIVPANEPPMVFAMGGSSIRSVSNWAAAGSGRSTVAVGGTSSRRRPVSSSCTPGSGARGRVGAGVAR
jgi:hypothetical protein